MFYLKGEKIDKIQKSIEKASIKNDFSKLEKLQKDLILAHELISNEEFMFLVNKKQLTEELLNKFIHQKGNINYQNKHKETPLILAVYANNPVGVKLLIDAGSNVNLQDQEGWTALMWACVFNHYEIVILLLNSNIDIHLKNKEGKTALDLLKNKNHQCYNALIQLLEQHMM